MPSQSPQTRQALEACRSLMPGGFGQGRRPGGGMDASALQAFRTCMKDNGAELPENGGMRGLKTEDPAIAKALKKCRPLLPTMPPRVPGGTASPTTGA
ncbi:hypothetical protein Skr01_53140 [Sphaerisporangium krabiense]|uniref:Uncharacterized protein n=1 Tax=Sphaerisporangium krabiense TaxID=763782 RepID=A0A7W8Z4I4_9ACTN|nr:hypothetical protein [Sphaerisporangium krabiense]MBB5627075.1 hypothetical protein [Sphaerisporangium krabiense]GII65229.1 hypothetical protein Skr01_53140 [Sphaerisporangium krabiense]